MHCFRWHKRDIYSYELASVFKMKRSFYEIESKILALALANDFRIFHVNELIVKHHTKTHSIFNDEGGDKRREQREKEVYTIVM